MVPHLGIDSATTTKIVTLRYSFEKCAMEKNPCGYLRFVTRKPRCFPLPKKSPPDYSVAILTRERTLSSAKVGLLHFVGGKH